MSNCIQNTIYLLFNRGKLSPCKYLHWEIYKMYNCEVEVMRLKIQVTVPEVGI